MFSYEQSSDVEFLLGLEENLNNIQYLSSLEKREALELKERMPSAEVERILFRTQENHTNDDLMEYLTCKELSRLRANRAILAQA